MSEPSPLNNLVQRMLDIAPVLKGLEILEAQKLLQFGRKATWTENERVFYEGEDADEMFILLGGKLHVWLNNPGKDNPIATLHPGENFGEMAILSGGKRGANVTAV